MTNRRVLIVLHEQLEDTGHVGQVLDKSDFEQQRLYPYRGDAVPADLAEYAGLIVMGGLTSVYLQDSQPYLHAELRLLDSALRQDVPILGICLGSQLLAAALGAQVYPARQREAGWFDVKLTAEGAADPLFEGVRDPFMALHWHSDNFIPPKNSLHLASTELTEYQAFRYRQYNYGLLFHIEPDERLFEHMLKLAVASEYINRTMAEIIARQAKVFLPEIESAARRIFSHWLELISARYAAPLR